MARSLSLVPIALVSLVATLGLGCQSSGGPEPVTGALTSGRIDGSSGASAEVPVQAYSMSADGSLVAASEPATTTADGHFELSVTLTDEASRLVVRVEDGTERMTSLDRAAIAIALRTSSTIVVPPVDVVSTFRAEVAAALAATGRADLTTRATLHAFLTRELALSLAAMPDRDAAVAAAARGVADASATFRHALLVDVAGGSSGNLDAALDAFLAQEARAAARADAGDLATETHLDGVVAGAMDAGYSAGTLAAAAVTAEGALEANVGGMTHTDAELSLFSTFAVTHAVEDRMAVAGVTVAGAGATLRTAMVALALHGGLTSEVSLAWSTYTAAVRAAVESRVALGATVVGELVADVASSANELHATWASLGATADVEARVGAIAAYRTSVMGSAHVSALTTLGMNEAEAHASLEALATVGAAAR